MKVGIQLYSVRNNMAKDALGTISRVAAAGYKYLEAANGNAANDAGIGAGISAELVNERLQQTGASIISAHISPLTLLLSDKAQGEKIMAYHKQIGTRFMVVPMDFFTGREDALKKAQALNEIGRICQQAGIELLYHNHFHEFQVFEGESVYDTLMNNTDPSLVKIELDTYWALRGGQDPVQMLKKYGKRVRLIHQKDFPNGYEEQLSLVSAMESATAPIDIQFFMKHVSMDTFAEIGTGIIDIQSIIDAANQYCGCEYIILEQDATKLDEMESIEISMQSFKKFKGIEL